MAKTTSTRARRKPDEQTVVRILNLIRVGLTAGVGAMITEIIEGEPNLNRVLR